MDCKYQFLGAMLLSFFSVTTSGAQGNTPNILFISVDDLRPELGVYGRNQVISPNIDEIVQDGAIFKNAYAQVSLSMPSRTSFLTGLQPINFWGQAQDAKVVTMPQHFKNNGYNTVSIGKIYHYTGEDKKGWTFRQHEADFDSLAHHGYASGYQLDKNINTLGGYFTAGWTREMIIKNNIPSSSSTEIVDAPDSLYPDAIIATKAIHQLNKLKKEDKPFFLAVGFYRPHLPYTVPKKYWDLYDVDCIDMAAHSSLPRNAIGVTDANELRRYGDIPKDHSIPLPIEKAKELKHGYYAGVSFIDVQVGRVMKELQKLGLDENTIVILFGDHGFLLGEHGLWSKNVNYEEASRTAFMINLPPSMNVRKGHFVTDALCGLIDMYPTLCDLAGLSIPSHVDGVSLKPILTREKKSVQKEVFSSANSSYSIRTDRYRFNRSHQPQKIWNSDVDSVGVYELYDYKKDPLETNNIAYDPNKQKLLKELEARMDYCLDEHKRRHKDYLSTLKKD